MHDNPDNDLVNTLTAIGQEHVLKHWGSLGDNERAELIADIKSLHLDEVQRCAKLTTCSTNEESSMKSLDIQPIPEAKLVSIERTAQEYLDAYREAGLRAISKGQVGVLLMAGGQGTRLGFAHPKGMYNVGLQSNKTLFQLQAERILKLQELAKEATGRDGIIIWYIMTSEHTTQATKDFLEANDYFGLNAKNVVFFAQGLMPCFDNNGKLILDKKHKISRSPDGNGGVYRALKEQGMLDDMVRRGIKYLHGHSVDNILTKVADPVFIGYCLQEEADCAAKVVQKTNPHEPVGVVAVVDGKYQVVEYSEISKEDAERRNADGQLTFNAGNICNHFFTTAFLLDIGKKFESQLKLHIAKKKIPYVNESGERITPTIPNGIKIEKFVFDVFEFTQKFVAMEVPREVEFSALKNADSAGKDCPSTARADLHRLHKKYIVAAGGTVQGDEVEISPFVSYSGENLEKLVNGKIFTSPVYLRSDRDPPVGHL